MHNKPFIPNERGCYPDSPRLPRSSEVIKPWCFPDRPGDPDEQGCYPESPGRRPRRRSVLEDLLRLL